MKSSEPRCVFHIVLRHDPVETIKQTTKASQRFTYSEPLWTADNHFNIVEQLPVFR